MVWCAAALCLSIVIDLRAAVLTPAARAETTGESTVGTASTVSPSTVAVGGTLTYTLSGFPQGATVQILIDDGALVSPAAAAAGNDVVTELVVGPDGTAAGTVELPDYVAKGTHWLRFRISAGQGLQAAAVSTVDYTNKSPYFTVGDVTVIGGQAAQPLPTAPPAAATMTPTPMPSSREVVAVEATHRPRGTAVEVPSDTFAFPFLGTGVLGLAILVSVLAIIVVYNRWRLARHERAIPHGA